MGLYLAPKLTGLFLLVKKSEQDGGRALGDSKQGLPCSPMLVSILLPTIQYLTYLNCSGKALRWEVQIKPKDVIST